MQPARSKPCSSGQSMKPEWARSTSWTTWSRSIPHARRNKLYDLYVRRHDLIDTLGPRGPRCTIRCWRIPRRQAARPAGRGDAECAGAAYCDRSQRTRSSEGQTSRTPSISPTSSPTARHPRSQGRRRLDPRSGKRDPRPGSRQFLGWHAAAMPRAARFAIEHLRGANVNTTFSCGIACSKPEDRAAQAPSNAGTRCRRSSSFTSHRAGGGYRRRPVPVRRWRTPKECDVRAA